VYASTHITNLSALGEKLVEVGHFAKTPTHNKTVLGESIKQKRTL
jgi:hypothetical protein